MRTPVAFQQRPLQRTCCIPFDRSQHTECNWPGLRGHHQHIDTDTRASASPRLDFVPHARSISNNNGPAGDFANLGGNAPGSITNNNDPGNPPPGAPPAGSYNLVTTTSDCAGHTSTSYSMVPGQGGVSYVSNNNCFG